MDNSKIAHFLTQVDKIERSGTRNARSTMFAQRVRQTVCDAYETVFDANWKKTGEYRLRDGKDSSVADAFIEMGVTEAVYGSGRSLLH